MLYRIPEKLARSTSALSITMLNVSPVSVKFLRAMPTRQYQAPEAGGALVGPVWRQRPRGRQAGAHGCWLGAKRGVRGPRT